MVAHMEAMPGFSDIGRMAWYPGKDAQYRGQMRAAQAALQGRLRA